MEVGANMPLACQLEDFATDKYVRATIRNAAGAEVTGSPVDLTHVADGYYSGVLAMPAVPVVVQCIVYTDALYTVKSDAHGPSTERFEPDAEASGGSSSITYASEVTGVVDDGEALESTSIIRGEDKTLIIRLFESDRSPHDLTDITGVTFRMKKTDGTALSKTLSTGVSITGSRLLGKLTVVLTDTETTGLKMDPRATIELFLDRGTTRSITQLLKAVSVDDPLV